MPLYVVEVALGLRLKYLISTDEDSEDAAVKKAEEMCRKEWHARLEDGRAEIRHINQPIKVEE